MAGAPEAGRYISRQPRTFAALQSGSKAVRLAEDDSASNSAKREASLRSDPFTSKNTYTAIVSLSVSCRKKRGKATCVARATQQVPANEWHKRRKNGKSSRKKSNSGAGKSSRGGRKETEGLRDNFPTKDPVYFRPVRRVFILFVRAGVLACVDARRFTI